MKRIGVLYDTTEGHTRKIARRIADSIKAAGHGVTVAEIRSLPADSRVDAFDGVIIGASIHVGKHAPAVVGFVNKNHDALQTIPSAFFSVSLSAAGKTERQQQNAQRCLSEFLSETAWSPPVTATFAGALLYRDYGIFKRLLMKWIAKREGGDTDASRNYEYTNWSQVDEFAEAFLRHLDDQPQRPR